MDQDKLARFITRYQKAGPHKFSREEPPYKGFNATPAAFPGITAGGKTFSYTGLDVHVTLPDSKEHCPVVFFYNCYAIGFQRCSWYFDYADHLASWGYVAVQFEDPANRSARVEPLAVEYISRCILAWASGQGAFEPALTGAATLDATRLGFVGHSKGGDDAESALTSVWDNVARVAAVSFDGVAPNKDLPASVATVGRTITLVKASVSSLGGGALSFNPTRGVDDILVKANTAWPRATLACTADNVAHFSFINPAARTWLLNMLQNVPFLNLDTRRPYKTAPGSSAVGVFDQCAGVMVAALENTLRVPVTPAWTALLTTPGEAAWTDNVLLERPLDAPAATVPGSLAPAFT